MKIKNFFSSKKDIKIKSNIQINPKFKVGDKVFFIGDKKKFKGEFKINHIKRESSLFISKYDYFYHVSTPGFGLFADEFELISTNEHRKNKLKDLLNE